MTREYPKPRPDLFWLVIGLMALAVMLTSCSNEFYCSKCVSHTKDSTFVRVDSIPFDTTIYLPGKIIEVHDTVPCEDFELKKDSNGIKIKIVVKDRVIYAKCETDALEAKIRLYRLAKSISRVRELNTSVNTPSKNNFWRWFTYWQTWVALGGYVILFAPKIIRLAAKIR